MHMDWKWLDRTDIAIMRKNYGEKWFLQMVLKLLTFVDTEHVLTTKFVRDEYWNKRIQLVLIGAKADLNFITFDKKWFGKEAKELKPTPDYLDKYIEYFKEAEKRREKERVDEMMKQLSEEIHFNCQETDYDKIESYGK